MSPAPSALRQLAVMAAAANDFNEDLTIILSSCAIAFPAVEPGHPARELLLDIQSAAQRCAWKASGLLNYAALRGARAGAATMERLIEDSAYMGRL